MHSRVSGSCLIIIPYEDVSAIISTNLATFRQVSFFFLPPFLFCSFSPIAPPPPPSQERRERRKLLAFFSFPPLVFLSRDSPSGLLLLFFETKDDDENCFANNFREGRRRRTVCYDFPLSLVGQNLRGVGTKNNFIRKSGPKNNQEKVHGGGRKQRQRVVRWYGFRLAISLVINTYPYCKECLLAGA